MSASAQPVPGTVVMKFGGSSVADPEKIRHVARRLVEAREGGLRVVATVSAMGDSTDALLELARQVSPQPQPRELDMLLSTGERIACALVAMAVHDFGHEAVTDPVSVHDFHATVLHLLGLDHEKLTYYHNGSQRRLTDVHGHVIRGVLA